jgi:hypothetical protein
MKSKITSKNLKMIISTWERLGDIQAIGIQQAELLIRMCVTLKCNFRL